MSLTNKPYLPTPSFESLRLEAYQSLTEVVLAILAKLHEPRDQHAVAKSTFLLLEEQLCVRWIGKPKEKHDFVSESR